jgi:hypothetical protein
MAQTTGLVTFQGQLNNYVVYLPNCADPMYVVKALELSGVPKYAQYDYERKASKLASDFLRNHSDAVLSGKNGRPMVAQHVYIVDVPNGKVMYQTKGKSTAVVSLADLEKQANPKVNLQNAVDKVIKFTYKGGSGNAERLVKVTAVEEKAGGTLIRGWDLQKSTGEQVAHRAYRVNNIVGEVQIIG